jgi:Uma2 family endonuclease
VAQPIQHTVFSYEEYLRREQETGLKHEWLDGQIFAMSGGTPEHARLIDELWLLLRGVIDPKRCRAFSSELKIRVKATGLATYPDVAVVCGPLELDSVDANAVVNPLVIAEVLSHTTEAYDRGEKWSHYRKISSLQAYLLVNQIRPRVEMYERTGDDFVYRVAEAGQKLRIQALDRDLDVDALYVADQIINA